jgi:hypothetical protein
MKQQFVQSSVHPRIVWLDGTDPKTDPTPGKTWHRWIDCATAENARLIAAAPDMLEALQALALLDFGYRGLKFDIDRAALIAREAIKKATNEN